MWTLLNYMAGLGINSDTNQPASSVRDSNLWPPRREADALTTRPPQLVFGLSNLITVSKRNYCTPSGIVLHAFPVMGYILLMKYQVVWLQHLYRYIFQNLHVVNIVQYGNFACSNSVYWLCNIIFICSLILVWMHLPLSPMQCWLQWLHLRW